MSSHFLNASRVGDSTTSLSSLFQCLATLFMKKFLLIASLNLVCCSSSSTWQANEQRKTLFLLSDRLTPWTPGRPGFSRWVTWNLLCTSCTGKGFIFYGEENSQLLENHLFMDYGRFSRCGWTGCWIISSRLPFSKKVGPDDLLRPLPAWPVLGFCTVTVILILIPVLWHSEQEVEIIFHTLSN